MSYLENVSHLDSVLSHEELNSVLHNQESIESNVERVVEVVKPYSPIENKDTITEVDNENYTISVTLQKSWFNSFEDFPAEGSPNIIYGDKTNKVLYIWNSDTSSYELFMDEGKVKDILVNGESVLSNDKIARITVAKSISELEDDIGLATKEETRNLIQETKNETSELVQATQNETVTLIQDSKNETATLIKAVRDETSVLIQNTQKETENSIANLIGGASEALDTLKEIEDWIRNDESGTANIVKQINELKETKVDKIEGKSLSTNDYTDEDKATLGILSESVSSHESDIELIKAEYINKDVDNLTNYYNKSNTYSKLETFSQQEINSLIASESVKYVASGTTINNKQLQGNVTLTANDIGCYNKEETETLISELKNDETIVKTTSQLIINGGTSEV